MELVYKKQGFIVNKFLPCLLITMFAFMCLFGSYVCATDVTFYNNDLPITITGMNNPYDNYAIFIDTNTGHDYDVYYIFSWDSTSSKLLYNLNSSGSTSFRCVDSNNNKVDYYFSFARSDNLDISSRTFDVKSSSFTPGNPYYFVYTNTNIYDYNNHDLVVFQAPPQQVEGIIASQTQGVEMNRILQEIVAILPVVLVVIVGILAIRKAIQFLTQLMKRQ